MTNLGIAKIFTMKNVYKFKCNCAVVNVKIDVQVSKKFYHTFTSVLNNLVNVLYLAFFGVTLRMQIF